MSRPDALRVLVIGCGYLGLRVARRWLDQRATVFAMTRSDSRVTEFEQYGIVPIRGDVTDAASLAHLPEVDVVLHAVGFDRSATPSKRTVYVDGLQSVLKAVTGRCQRFIHVSSTSVYAQQTEEWVDEQSPCEARDESGCICRDAEALIHRASTESTRTAFNILRLSGIYGPQRLLSRIEAIQSGTALPGPSDSWLNLIHVDDAATAVLACADRGEVGATYLVSDDRPIRRHEYYRELARLLKAPEPQFDESLVARHTKGNGKRCLNRRLKQELQMTLAYPTIETGLVQALGLAVL